MAGQRGASQNVGLMARQAAQQGAATQQQAAGQAATMQAQQQIAYQQALGSQANQMVGQQAAATNNQTQMAENQQQYLGSTAAGLQSNVNSANASLANTQVAGQQNLIGNLAGGLGQAAMLMADGGTVGAQPTADLSNLTANSPISAAPVTQATQSGPKSSVGKFLSGMGVTTPQASAATVGSGFNAVGQAIGQAIFGKPSSSTGIGERDSSDMASQYVGANSELNDAAMKAGQDYQPSSTEMSAANDPRVFAAAHGGMVPVALSPGEMRLSPKEAKEVVTKGKNPLKVGKKVPGKPKHPGNDYRNDTYKTKAAAGGVIIPNSVMQSKNPHFEAMKFVHAHIAKNRKGLK